MKVISLILCINLWWVGNGFGNEVEFIFQEGNRLYETGNYEAAIVEYEKVLNAGYENGELYFNLGNAFYKSGYIGKAIINYERARKYLPNDEDVAFNLELANLRVVDRIQALPNPFGFIYRWAGIFSISGLTTSLILFLYFLSILWIYRIARGSDYFGRVIKTTHISVTTLLTLVVLLLSIRIYEAKTHIDGVIIVQYPVEVRSAPTDDGTELFVIHEGVKFRLRKEINNWMEIQLADGKTGWLKKETFEII